MFAKEGGYPGVSYPVVPGHEIAGRSRGAGRAACNGWEVGQRVGVGWFGGNCGYCEWCRRGDAHRLPEHGDPRGHHGRRLRRLRASSRPTRWPRCPTSSPTRRPAPLLCAGITTFNALRHSGARPAAASRCSGVGGLGHLGVQFAAKMGFETVAIARGTDKEELARQARRPPLHRQHRRRPGRGAAGSRRRRRDPVHGDQRRCDGGGVRRPAAPRPADRRRRRRWIRSECRRRR